MTEHLLPGNATGFEKAVSETLDREAEFTDAITAIAAVKYKRPLPAGFAPWLVHEYALGLIERFHESADDAIGAGLPWLKVRATPEALEIALSWIGYTNLAIEDANTGRRIWNRYQLVMGELPGLDEAARLGHAEYLAGVSDGARDVFFRGYQGYDVREVVFGSSRWSGAIWADVSGVFIGGETKWSHGQAHSADLSGDGSARLALGVDFAEGDAVTWGPFPWNMPGLIWDGISDVPAAKAFLILRQPVWIGFYKANGEVIGYRRVGEDRKDVTSDHMPVGDEVFLQFGVRTGFGDGAGEACATVKLVFNGRPAAGLKPGLQWLAAGQIAFDDGVDEAEMTVGSAALSITFGKTIRERVVVTLSI